MNLQEAIAAINASGLENAAVVADFVRSLGGDLESYKEDLNSITQERDRLAENNPQLLGQLKSARRERDSWKEKFQGIANQFLQEGDDEAIAEQRLADLAAEVEALNAARVEAEQARAAALGEVSKLKGEVTLRDASNKLGVDPLLLQRLVPVDPANYVLDEDGVKIVISEGEETKQVNWSEYLEQQPPAIRQALNLQPTPDDAEPPTPLANTPPRRPSAPPSAPPNKAVKVEDTLGRMGFNGPQTTRKEA